LRNIILACALGLSLTACGSPEQAAGENPNGSTQSPVGDNATVAADSAGKGKFDIAAVPVSTAALGTFPYFSLPDGYQPLDKPETQDFGHFPFWTGKELHDVVGKVYFSGIGTADDKTFSAYELQRNIDAVIREAGGVLVTESKIPAELRDQIPREIRVGMVDGLGDIYNNPVSTWLVRRDDRQIWIHFTSTTAGANWTIVETKPFKQTASLLSADALQDEIDRTGKATIHINFAVDKASILPESRPQINAVAVMLDKSPSLKLAINGHTDNSGTAAHNRALSEARAASVRGALVQKGIDAARLQSKGFGADQPVADNGSEAGKAQNRRVELVRI